jgi:hypothetical protein
MPVPQYVPFRQKQKPVSLRDVTGGMNPSEVVFEVERGARFVYFDYVISVIIMSHRRNSPVFFLKPGESAVRKGLPYALLSLAFGWWGFPWGLTSTPGAIARTLRGGHDITAKVLSNTQGHMSRASAQSARTGA